MDLAASAIFIYSLSERGHISTHRSFLHFYNIWNYNSKVRERQFKKRHESLKKLKGFSLTPPPPKNVFPIIYLTRSDHLFKIKFSHYQYPLSRHMQFDITGLQVRGVSVVSDSCWDYFFLHALARNSHEKP